MQGYIDAFCNLCGAVTLCSPRLLLEPVVTAYLLPGRDGLPIRGGILQFSKTASVEVARLPPEAALVLSPYTRENMIIVL